MTEFSNLRMLSLDRALCLWAQFTHCFSYYLAALTFRDETKTRNFVPHVTEKWGTEMTKNTESVLKQFVFSDSDENSLSDKSRRAYCVKRRNQVNDTPAKDL